MMHDVKATLLCLLTFLIFALINSDLLEFSHKLSHNKGYKVVPERGQLNYVNYSIADVKMKVFVYNRTVKPLNMSFCFYKDLTSESTMVTDVYQFKSNEYKLTAIQFTLKLEQVLKMQWFGLDLFFSNAVPPMKWPVKINVTYRISNWYPDSSLFTFAYNSVGRWKGNAVWYLDKLKKEIICDYDYYISIEEVY